MDFSLSTMLLLSDTLILSVCRDTKKFVIVAASLSGGNIVEILTTKNIKKNWSKTILGIEYNDIYYRRTQDEGWAHSSGQGKFTLTGDGLEHLEEICNGNLSILDANQTPGLKIFLPGKTHSFDKELRSILSSAIREIMIADSYVDETIFDNLLDQIPESVNTRILFGNDRGNFMARFKRFKPQYTKFIIKISLIT